MDFHSSPSTAGSTRRGGPSLKQLHLEDISDIANFTGTTYTDNVIIGLINSAKLKRRHWCIGANLCMTPFGSVIEGYVLSANKGPILVYRAGIGYQKRASGSRR